MAVHHGFAGRIKQQCTGNKKSQPDQYSCLVGKPLDEDGRWNCKTEIGSVKGILDEGRLKISHAHDFLECGQ